VEAQEVVDEEEEDEEDEKDDEETVGAVAENEPGGWSTFLLRQPLVAQ